MLKGKISNLGCLSAILIGIFVPGCEKEKQVLPTDGDGNVYDTVVIGSQVWLAENLKTTKYTNGVSISLVIDSEEWASLSSAAYCWYDNHPDFKNTYGALYNWYAGNAGNLCPEGYHVPTKDDWTILIDHLGGEKVAGGKLKEAGLLHWQSPNTGASNESGFTALAGGFRNFNGSSVSIGYEGWWWTSTPGPASEKIAYRFFLRSVDSWIVDGSWEKTAGKSIRCMKDNR